MSIKNIERQSREGATVGLLIFFLSKECIFIHLQANCNEIFLEWRPRAENMPERPATQWIDGIKSVASNWQMQIEIYGGVDSRQIWARVDDDLAFQILHVK